MNGESVTISLERYHEMLDAIERGNRYRESVVKVYVNYKGDIAVDVDSELLAETARTIAVQKYALDDKVINENFHISAWGDTLASVRETDEVSTDSFEPIF